MKEIVLDTETTGLEKTDQVISFAAVKIENREITDRMSFWCKPTCRIHPDAERVHGISLRMLDGHLPFRDHIDDLEKFFAGADRIVAHNAPFDMGMLDEEYTRAGRAEKLHKRFQVIDTLAVARRTLFLRRNRLGDLCAKFGVEYDTSKAHGAVYDADVLADVYLKMTAGQAKLQLPEPVRAAIPALPTTTSIKRIVFLPSEVELKAHAEFCKSNNITVF